MLSVWFQLEGMKVCFNRMKKLFSLLIQSILNHSTYKDILFKRTHSTYCIIFDCMIVEGPEMYHWRKGFIFTHHLFSLIKFRYTLMSPLIFNVIHNPDSFTFVHVLVIKLERATHLLPGRIVVVGILSSPTFYSAEENSVWNLPFVLVI